MESIDLEIQINSGHEKEQTSVLIYADGGGIAINQKNPYKSHGVILLAEEMDQIVKIYRLSKMMHAE